MSIDTNFSAFTVITAGSAATILSTISFISADTTAKAVKCGSIALACMTVTLSGVTAWFDPSSKNEESYWENVAVHACYGIPSMALMVCNLIFNAALKGVSKAIERRVCATVSQLTFSK